MKKLSTLWKVLNSLKYPLVIGFFVLLVGFLDENSCVSRRQRQAHMRELAAERDSLKLEHDADSIALDELETDPFEAERIAREDYFMHRDNEDVFIVPTATTE